MLRALKSKSKVSTRYGGGFVQSIEGVDGSARRHQDWFWFVNGLSGDRSATSYRLRDGDVAWWDYRDWSGDADTLEVVAGAFPEPFLHGYDGKTRAAAVRYGAGPSRGRGAGRDELGADDVAPVGTAVPRGRQPVRARDRSAAPDRGDALAGQRPDGCRALLVRRIGAAAARRRLRAQVLEPVSAGPATALLAAAAIAAFLIDGIAALAAMTVILLVLCLRAPVQRRWLYIGGALFSALGVIVISPLTWSSGGGTLLWEGPTLPVIGPLDLSTDEIQIAIVNGLRLAVVALAFSAYTLLVDHDRLVSAAGFARRSALAVALATRLVPSLERDAAGFAESVRGRGVELHGVRGYAMLLSPLVAGSLERATGLAEAMEARGFGRSETTRAPRPAWTWVDHVAIVAALALVAVAIWL